GDLLRVRWYMVRRRNWVAWLSLAACVLWAAGREAIAQETSLQQRLAGQIPLEQLPEAVRPRVRAVLEQPSLFGHGPAEAFAGRPALYTWLLDHPDRVVLAWRRLGAQCTEVTDHGNGLFGWKDGYGGEVRWQTVHDSPRLRVWYAEGRIRPT